MTIRHMRIFIVVFQEMNITKAAEVLHMTQPAVSRAIQELESYYGIHLFERIHHRLFRTESSYAFYARALHLIDSFDSLEKTMKNWDELGVLRIGGTITMGNFVLPGLVSEFQKIHPNLQVRVTISNSQNLQQALLDNRLDLALIEGGISSEELTSELLTEDHLVLIFPSGHPLCLRDSIVLADLIQYPFLVREKGSAGRTFLDHVFAAHGIDFVPLWESASTQALIQAVSAGIGISILPERLVQRDLAEEMICTHPIEDETFRRNNYIAWHHQKFLTDTAKDFIALCHQHSTKAGES